MIDTLIAKVRLIVKDPILRKRVFFVLFALVLFRVAAAVPIPGARTSNSLSLSDANFSR